MNTMNIAYINSLQSEWLKKKKSMASWLVLVGAFFVPAIVIVIRLVFHEKLAALYSKEGFWQSLWNSMWESMAMILLPIGAILATSLITQLEYKNNAWKQLHAMPLAMTTIFFSKLSIIVLMMLQFFLLFNIGIYLTALVPYLLVGSVPYPKDPMPWAHFAAENLRFFIDCLPIIAMQYLISLQFRNFIVPVGIGMVLWFTALASLPWKHGYIIPYIYTALNYIKDNPGGKAVVPDINFHLIAILYFVVITTAGYVLFVTKKEKG